MKGSTQVKMNPEMMLTKMKETHLIYRADKTFVSAFQ